MPAADLELLPLLPLLLDFPELAFLLLAQQGKVNLEQSLFAAGLLGVLCQLDRDLAGQDPAEVVQLGV